MNVHSLSVVVGSTACNAKCPFCVSKMTPNNGVEVKVTPINSRNLRKAISLAKSCGVNTALITGKGEPTLFPMQISDALFELGNHFPLIELQTNGLKLHEPDMDEYLTEWYNHGLTMINVSVVSQNPVLNQQIYTGDKPYPDLNELIKKLHKHGFSVRLSVTMLDKIMSSWEDVKSFLVYARSQGVEQVTMRPVASSRTSKDLDVTNFVRSFELKKVDITDLDGYFEFYGTRILTLPHGGCIYDVDGQNVCWTDCLTLPDKDDIRQLIYFPDGHLRYDWQYTGAIIF